MRNMAFPALSGSEAEAPRPVLAMHPRKFLLWLFIVSVVMLFAAFTSAYIVRRGEGDWLEFSLPALLWYNTIIILLSSVTMQWAHYAASKDQIDQVKIAISVTTLLGIGFLVAQVMAWNELVAMQVFFTGNPSGSFLYVITGMHGLHIVGGVVFLLIVLVKAFQHKVHAKRMVSIDMCNTFWHFLDGLWLYLFLFLLLNHA